MKNGVRILILGAAFGAGHLKAGTALQEGLAGIGPEWETRVYNYVNLVHPGFDRFSQQFYFFMVRHLPSCYAYFYRLTDAREPRAGYLLDRFGQRTLQRLVDEFKPQAVVATFPTPGRAAATLKIEGRLNLPVVMVITDHTAHAEWLHSGVDLYLVADEDVGRRLCERGVSPFKVKVTGIPIHSGFAHMPEAKTARERLGLDQDRPLVLLVGGGNGRVAAMEEMIYALSRLRIPAQVVVIVGKDRQYLKRLSSRFGKNPSFRFYGFVENMVDFMAAADLLIGKAGGLTLAEAAAAGLPVIIYRCLPAQEEANATYYTGAGAALRVQHPAALTATAEKILLDVDGIATSLRRAVRGLARPLAAVNAAAAIAELIESRRIEDG